MKIVDLLFIVSTCLLAIVFLTKLILHISLDEAKGQGFDFYKQWKYFLPYREGVPDHLMSRKMVCNKIQKALIGIFSFLLLVVILRTILTGK